MLKDFEGLPEEKKMEVIDFIEFLKAKEKKEIENIMDDVINDNLDALRELSK